MVGAFMTIGSMIIAAGWNIALKKNQPFAFIVFYLSNQELKTMVLRHSQKMEYSIQNLSLKVQLLQLWKMWSWEAQINQSFDLVSIFCIIYICYILSF